MLLNCNGGRIQMKTKIFKTIKAVTIGLMLVVASMGLAGCGRVTEPTVSFNESQVTEMLETQSQRYQSTIENISTEANQIISEKEQMIQHLQEQIATEVVEEVAEEQNVSASYFVDEVKLDGNFQAKLYNEDLDTLYFETLKYNNKVFDVEEVFTISSDTIPVFNIEDKNEKVFLSLDKGSLTYEVKFIECVDVVENKQLSFKFLGEDVTISSVSDDEVVLYKGTEIFVTEGASTIFGEHVVSIEAINSNGKVLVKVSKDSVSESKIISEEDNVEILGLNVFVEESFSSDNKPGFVTLQLSLDEIKQTIEDGDEYIDDRYDWKVSTKDGKLCSIGVTLTEEYIDEDDVLSIGDKVCLPNNYKCVSLQEVENSANIDLGLSLSKSKLSLNFDGKIEINGRRSENVVINTIKEEVKFKTASTTNTLSLDDANIVLFNDKRELPFTVSSDVVSLGDYSLNIADGKFIKDSLTDIGFDEDDNKLRNNGDILYRVKDLKDASKVNFKLIGKDVSTVTLKVE
jgi:hypothetical protein